MWHPIKRWIERHADDPDLEERLLRIYQLTAELAVRDYIFGQRDALIITERAIAEAAQAAEREQQQQRAPEGGAE